MESISDSPAVKSTSMGIGKFVLGTFKVAYASPTFMRETLGEVEPAISVMSAFASMLFHGIVPIVYSLLSYNLNGSPGLKYSVLGACIPLVTNTASGLYEGFRPINNLEKNIDSAQEQNTGNKNILKKIGAGVMDFMCCPSEEDLKNYFEKRGIEYTPRQ